VYNFFHILTNGECCQVTKTSEYQLLFGRFSKYAVSAHLLQAILRILSHLIQDVICEEDVIIIILHTSKSMVKEPLRIT
jgi:hypothetical protein